MKKFLKFLCCEKTKGVKPEVGDGDLHLAGPHRQQRQHQRDDGRGYAVDRGGDILRTSTQGQGGQRWAGW